MDAAHQAPEQLKNLLLVQLQATALDDPGIESLKLMKLISLEK